MQGRHPDQPDVFMFVCDHCWFWLGLDQAALYQILVLRDHQFLRMDMSLVKICNAARYGPGRMN